MSTSRWSRVIAAAVGVATVAGSSVVLVGASAQTSENVTTYGYSNARTGDGPSTAIRALSAAPVWTTQLNAAVYGEPLVDGGDLYVETEQDGLYELSMSTGRVLWHIQLGVAARTAVIDRAPGLGDYCGDIDPLGITGTPVIDPANDTIYVAEETMVGGTTWSHVHHELLGVSLATHQILWRRYIDPPGGNNPNDYVIAAQQQRPALTLANGRIYVAFGGLSGDCGNGEMEFAQVVSWEPEVVT